MPFQISNLQQKRTNNYEVDKWILYFPPNLQKLVNRRLKNDRPQNKIDKN